MHCNARADACGYSDVMRVVSNLNPEDTVANPSQTQITIADYLR